MLWEWGIIWFSLSGLKQLIGTKKIDNIMMINAVRHKKLYYFSNKNLLIDKHLWHIRKCFSLEIESHERHPMPRAFAKKRRLN